MILEICNSQLFFCTLSHSQIPCGLAKITIGGADGKHGLEEYLQTKVVYIQQTR